MEQFKIYCTEDQARKAIELGAPIEYKEVTDFEGHLLDYEIIDIPTAEEMIGWLEEQENIKEVCVCIIDSWEYIISNRDKKPLLGFDYNSRKEATLAAIDATLNYLVHNEK